MTRLRRILTVSLLALLTLGAVLVTRALRYRAKPRVSAKIEAPGVNAQSVAAHLAQAVRFRTVSHQDPRDDDRSTFSALRAWLEQTYPRVHAHLQREVIADDALLFRWEGSDPNAQPVLFMAHQDVVPIEPGTESHWTHPPFEGVLADGYVWGRGAIDDKGALIALFEAFEALLAEGYQPVRSVYLASGFDEEVGGGGGAKRIAQWLAQRGVRFQWVLDEGGVITQGVAPFLQRPAAAIALGEKGYLTLELIAHAKGGHSSMPSPVTAIGALSRAVANLERQPFEARLTKIMRESFDTLSAELPWPPRLVLANTWLTEPLVLRLLLAAPQTAATVRTTIAPTIVQGGVKENVLPSSARAVVNFRILSGDSTASVITHVERAIDEPSVQVRVLDRARSEPTPVSSTHGPGFRLLQSTLQAVYPDAIVLPTIVNGATDARHFRPIADAVYHFVPWMATSDDLKRVHGTDERLAIDQLAVGVHFFRELLRNAAR